MSAWDAYDTYQTITSDCATTGEKWASGGLFTAGLFLPGNYKWLGNVAKGLGNQNPLYKAAVQSFKSTDLSNAGRALTKHPEVIGQTKETLRQTLRTDAALNEAAHSALRNIMRNGVTTTPTLGRYGTVTQVQIPGGFGARWASDGSFIGFINP
ncbi:hypothetical protein [Alcanivorax nanhaiticus]|uniref:hypothetical protein n=1 Tax=Alcanivorax nanhaiticus TaxID=1177154 RepID=UPI0018CD704D|nr:hypothetical protein [Alcanivorax nanhaiticus]